VGVRKQDRNIGIPWSSPAKPAFTGKDMSMTLDEAKRKVIGIFCSECLKICDCPVKDKFLTIDFRADRPCKLRRKKPVRKPRL
jgi:hypothetical protein